MTSQNQPQKANTETMLKTDAEKPEEKPIDLGFLTNSNQEDIEFLEDKLSSCSKKKLLELMGLLIKDKCKTYEDIKQTEFYKHIPLKKKGSSRKGIRKLRETPTKEVWNCPTNLLKSDKAVLDRKQLLNLLQTTIFHLRLIVNEYTDEGMLFIDFITFHYNNDKQTFKHSLEKSENCNKMFKNHRGFKHNQELSGELDKSEMINVKYLTDSHKKKNGKYYKIPYVEHYGLDYENFVLNAMKLDKYKDKDYISIGEFDKKKSLLTILENEREYNNDKDYLKNFINKYKVDNTDDTIKVDYLYPNRKIKIVNMKFIQGLIDNDYYKNYEDEIVKILKNPNEDIQTPEVITPTEEIVETPIVNPIVENPITKTYYQSLNENDKKEIYKQSKKLLSKISNELVGNCINELIDNSTDYGICKIKNKSKHYPEGIFIPNKLIHPYNLSQIDLDSQTQMLRLNNYMKKYGFDCKYRRAKFDFTDINYSNPYQNVYIIKWDTEIDMLIRTPKYFYEFNKQLTHRIR